MNKKIICLTGLMLCLAAFVSAENVNLDDDSKLIWIETFDRFGPGKPAYYGDKVEILEENGGRIARMTAVAAVLPANGYGDSGGTDYLFQMRFRFGEPPAGGWILFSYNANGSRGDYKYGNYTLRFERSAILVQLNGGDKEKQNPNPVPQLKFEENDIPQLKNGQWYNAWVSVTPEKTVVYMDVRNPSVMEKLLEFKTNFGTGRYSVTANTGTDFDFFRITALDASGDIGTSGEIGEGAVGPTNAAEQAEAAKN